MGRVMPRSQLSTLRSDNIDRPRCPICGQPMWMVKVEYQRNSTQGRQTFKCPVCEEIKANDCCGRSNASWLRLRTYLRLSLVFLSDRAVSSHLQAHAGYCDEVRTSNRHKQ